MIQLQVISKILATKDLSILENNLLTRDYFVGYEFKNNLLKVQQAILIYCMSN